MMNETQFGGALEKISRRMSNRGNYGIYEILENDWLGYKEEIYLINYNNQSQLRLICCESCPEDTNNYMFCRERLDTYLTTENDKYLQQIYNGVFPLNNINFNRLTRREALVQLAQQNILILDLLPTHGICLYTLERKRINESPVKELVIDFDKITTLPHLEEVDLNYIFAVPPSLYTQNFIKDFLPDYFIDRGNINIGLGSCPNRNALERIIEDGHF